MKNKYLTLLFAVFVLVFIALTFYFLVKGNNHYLKEVLSQATTTSDVTALNLGSQSSSTVPHAESVVEKKVKLQDGVTQEVRNEVPVKEWKNLNGTVVTLYEKDYFFEDNYDPAREIILKAKRPNGDTQVLLTDTPSTTPRFGTLYVAAVEFSPKGDYVVVGEGLYESYKIVVFDLKTGKPVPGNDAVYSSEYAWPSWNADESKLLLLSSAVPIGGCEHCPGVWYSSTGNFSDAVAVVDLSKGPYDEPFFVGAVLKGDVVEFKAIYYDPNNNNQEKTASVTFSFLTGKLSSEIKYLNN